MFFKFATIMLSRFHVYVLHAIQRIFEMLFGQLLVYLISQMKWRNLMLNWTLLRLFDFMIIA